MGLKRLFIALFFVSILGGVSAANVSFSPASQIVGINDQFEVNVTANNFTDLYSYQFDVTYNSTILQYIGIAMGPFLTSDGGNALELTPNTTIPGLIKNYAVTRYGTTQGVSGNGVIAKIIFKGLIIGNSSLVMLNDLFYDSNETNPQEIVHTKTPGNVSVVNCDVDGDTYRALICGGADCNDTNALEYPGQIWYRDGDRDRYGNGTTLSQCTRPLGYNVSTELIANNTDCNDTNAAVNPGATEVCNGIDDDCEGGIDEGVQLTWYRDFDLDTFGNLTNTALACNQPAGYVSNNTDCNDNNALEKPGQIWYRDGDRDRYSNGTTLTQCLRPSGYNVTAELIAISGDCNDTNAAVNPGATEVCNGIDDNCVGGIDEIFTNETCSFVCTYFGFNFNVSRPLPYTCCGNNPLEDSPFQSSESSCADGRDNDCNGIIDMADLSCLLLSYDINKDGFVNIADIQMAGSPLWFGNTCNALNTWCGGRDVNQNGVLNIQDLSLIGMHFT